MKNLKFATKMSLVLGLSVLLCLGITGYLLSVMNNVNTKYNRMLTQEVQQSDMAREMQVTFKKQVQEWKNVLLRGHDPKALDKYSKGFHKQEAKVRELAEHLQQSLTHPEAQVMLKEFHDAHQKMGAGYAAALKVFRQSAGRDPVAADKMVKGQDRAPTNLIDNIVESLQQHMTTLRSSLQRSVAKKQKVTAITVAGMIGFLCITVVWLIRSMTGPLKQMAATAAKMASGDLSQQIDYQGRDEIGQLANAFNNLTVSLRQILSGMASATESLAVSSGELSTASEQMTNRVSSMSDTTNSAASASKEMSANMVSVAEAADQATTNVNMVATATEEMTSTVNEIAQNAEKTRGVTAEAVQNVAMASSRVDELGVSSQEISKVTDVIMEIAEQTKLLALNATIEAARAGEAGRGFAVVANEVKELAQQTNTATEDIRVKIETMQQATDGTVTEMAQINRVITEVNDLVTSIATAVEEQAITTRDITSNIGQAATVINEVTGTVKKAAEASEMIATEIVTVSNASSELETVSAQLETNATGLSSTGQELQTTVGRFKLDSAGSDTAVL